MTPIDRAVIYPANRTPITLLTNSVIYWPNCVVRKKKYMGVVLVIIILLIPTWLIASSIKKQKQLEKWREKWRYECKVEARAFLQNAKANKGIPKVQTNLMLKDGEMAYYCSDADLYETRSVRTTTTAFTGVRVMPSVYIGGSRGGSSSTQEWMCISSGKLVVTNKRLIFDGGNTDRNILLSKIFSAESSVDGVEVSCENRQKSMIFACKNPLILAIIVRICASAPDPGQLGEINLDITIT